MSASCLIDLIGSNGRADTKKRIANATKRASGASLVNSWVTAQTFAGNVFAFTCATRRPSTAVTVNR